MNHWSLVYEEYRPGEEGLREALCTLGNGVFATRGAAAESGADGVHYPGTYAGGVYNRLTTSIGGREVENEDLVNLPNWLPLTFRIDDGDWFHIDHVELVDYRQELDLRRGVLTRLIDFHDSEGRRSRVTERRIVHMGDPRFAALEVTLTPVGWSGAVEFLSAVDGRVENRGVPRYRELASRHLLPVAEKALDEDAVLLVVETSQSRLRIAAGMRTTVVADAAEGEVRRSNHLEPAHAAQHLAVPAMDGRPVRVEKVVALATSRQRALSEPGEEAASWVRRAGDFEELLASHVLAWDHLWQRCELQVEGADHAQRILNLHAFHILQTVSEHSCGLDVGVPARGIHGEAYRGHVFWDEIFVFPFLNYRLPDLTRSLLLYRYRRLPEARWAAREAGYRGAMFPWQSGSNGREETQEVHLNPRSGRWLPDHSRLQRHVGVAIAYNVWQYYQVSEDRRFLAQHGAEMLVEIARFWASIARYDRGMDRYRILGVMGPDEYHDGYPDRDTPGLDDNAYTNVMAVWVLLRALETLTILAEEERKRLVERLRLGREEIEEWELISRKMRVPFHGDGIISQFDGYDRLEEFDWDEYRSKYGDVQRLDRILEAEDDTPNRYKVSKQADVLMLFYLLSAEELEALFTRLGYPWRETTIPENITYYLDRTSHGSTLSWVVHAWVLARSDRRASWDLFNAALESDVGDIQGGTTREGIHLGAMAGTVDLVQRCYTGLECRGDALRLASSLPEELGSLQFRLQYRGRWLRVHIEDRDTVVAAEPDGGGPVLVEISGREMVLSPEEVAEA